MMTLALLVVAYAINPRLFNRLVHRMMDNIQSWVPKKNPGKVEVEVGESKDCD